MNDVSTCIITMPLQLTHFSRGMQSQQSILFITEQNFVEIDALA